MPRFVLLEHRWDGVHWDLMLERDGALATWAVAAEVVPGIDLPARRLPDHRLAYLDFEGPIAGDRGVVRRLDRGDYEATTWTDDEVIVAARGAQIAGDVRLTRVAPGCDGGAAWRLRIGKRA